MPRSSAMSGKPTSSKGGTTSSKGATPEALPIENPKSSWRWWTCNAWNYKPAPELQFCDQHLTPRSSSRMMGTSISTAISTLKELFLTEANPVSVNLTAAEEAVRGLTFDKFKETAFVSEKYGISKENYLPLVTRLCERYEFPDNICGELEALAKHTHIPACFNFLFETAKDGRLVFARLITRLSEDNSSIDMLLGYYSMGYKLTPQKTQHEKQKRFLFIPLGKETWMTTEERNLSKTDCNHFVGLYQTKAFEAWNAYITPSTANAIEY